MAKEELITAEGVIHSVDKDTKFLVKVGEHILCGTISGPLRMRRIKLRFVEKDKVIVKISKYDLTRCIIVSRVKTVK